MTDVVNSSTIGGDRAVVPVTTSDGHGALAQAVVLVDPSGVYAPPASGAVADGADVAEGAKADAAWSGSGAGSVISVLKALWAALTGTVKVAPPAGIGQQSTAASVSVATSKDQDPIFDHANGAKTSVTASATVLTPPAGCLYARISSDVDIYVNTAGVAAVDDGTSIRIVANVPEVIPVVAGTLVKALSSSGTATVRCTPLKSR